MFDYSTIGKLPVVYHMHLDNSVHPTICTPRQVPLSMKDKIIEELNRMSKLGVIKPVQDPTEWVSAMVAAGKKTARKALLRPHHLMKTVDQAIADMPGAKVFSILDAKCGFWQVPLSEESSKLTTFMTPRAAMLSSKCLVEFPQDVKFFRGVWSSSSKDSHVRLS